MNIACINQLIMRCESTDHEYQLSAIVWKMVYNFVVIMDDLVEIWNQNGKDAFVNSMLGIN